MRRRAAALLVTLLVVLAGCSSVLETRTTTEGTPDARTDLPPGVESSGEVNETRLLRTHLNVTADSSWTFEHRNGNDSTTVYRANGTELYRDEKGVTWTRNHTEVTNDTVLDHSYSVSFAKDAFSVSQDSGIIVMALSVRLSTAHYERTGTRTVNGTTLHVLNMTEARGGGTELGHYTGRMLVDRQGRIHRLWGEVGENESAADRYNFEYQWGLESVPTPDWFERIPRGVAAKTNSGTTFNVTLTAGPRVPAGTELTFEHSDTEKTVTLDEPLRPGESLYLGLRKTGSDDYEVIRSRQPLSNDSLIDLQGAHTALQGEVTLPDGTKIRLSFEIGYSNF